MTAREQEKRQGAQTRLPVLGVVALLSGVVLLVVQVARLLR